MKIITGALIAAALLLSGCGGGDQSTSEPKTKEPLPKVSAATTCGQLLDGNDPPMPAIIDLMSGPESMPSDARDARGFASDLTPIAAQANDELGPHVQVVIDELGAFADAVDDRASFDTSAIVTSLTELNNVCSKEDRPGA